MPSALPTVSRRRVLLGTAGLALLGGTVATACGSTASVQQVDALVAQLDRAHGDSQLAGNAATAAPPKLAAALVLVAQQRAAHAKALTDEITRMSGATPTTSPTGTTESAPPSPSSPSAPPPKPPTVADVVAALEQSADAAALLATQQSGYRAGLLGSIAAACTAATAVALANPGPTT